MRTTLLLLPLIAGCTTTKAFLASDASFQPHARELPVDVCLLHKPSAPYRLVGTLRVEAWPEDALVEVQRLALVEAARVGCELLISPQLLGSTLSPPPPFILTHGGDDHSGGGMNSGGAASGAGQGAGQGSGDARKTSDPSGAGRNNANRRVVHEFGCGVYRTEQGPDA